MGLNRGTLKRWSLSAPAPRCRLGVRAPRAPSQCHLAPSQRPPSRDAPCSTPLRYAPCRTTGPPAVSPCASSQGHRTTTRCPSLSPEASRLSLLKAALLHRAPGLAPAPKLRPRPAIETATANSHARPAAYPTKAPSTSSCTCYSSPARSLSPRSRHLAGARATVAAAAWCHRTSSPTPSPPRFQPQTDACEFMVTSPPFSQPPAPPSRRILAGTTAPWPRTQLRLPPSSRGVLREPRVSS
jgi:hypothetical protein